MAGGRDDLSGCRWTVDDWAAVGVGAARSVSLPPSAQALAPDDDDASGRRQPRWRGEWRDRRCRDAEERAACPYIASLAGPSPSGAPRTRCTGNTARPVAVGSGNTLFFLWKKRQSMGVLFAGQFDAFEPTAVSVSACLVGITDRLMIRTLCVRWAQ